MPPYTLREGLSTAQKASAKTYKRLQPIAPGYSGVSRPRRALLVRRSGETHLYPPHATSPPGSPLLLGQSLSDTRKAVGGCPLPPPFLSLPLIGSRWRNVTPVALR